MKTASSWLPVYVERLVSGNWTFLKDLRNFLSEVELDLNSLRKGRMQEEHHWRRMFLSRTYLLSIERLGSESEAELESLRKAVEKLKVFVDSPSLLLARQAQAHINLAEQAHRRFLRERMDMLPRLHTFQMSLCA